MSETTRWRSEDADYPNVVRGLMKVFDGGDARAIMDEFAAHIALLEQRNEAWYSSLRERIGVATGRITTLAFALAAMLLWANEKKLLESAPRWTSYAAILVAAAAAAAGSVAIIAALRADGMTAFTRIKPEALNPFLQDDATAASVDAYRLWLLPGRLDAERETALGLRKAARAVRMMQAGVAAAIGATLVLATFLGTWGLL